MKRYFARVALARLACLVQRVNWCVTSTRWVVPLGVLPWRAIRPCWNAAHLCCSLARIVVLAALPIQVDTKYGYAAAVPACCSGDENPGVDQVDRSFMEP